MAARDCLVRIEQDLNIFAFDVDEGARYFDDKGMVHRSGKVRVYLPVYEVPPWLTVDQEVGRLLYETAERVDGVFDSFPSVLEDLPPDWDLRGIRYLRQGDLSQLDAKEILVVNGDLDFVGVLIEVSNIPRGIAAFAFPESLRIYTVSWDERTTRLDREVL